MKWGMMPWFHCQWGDGRSCNRLLVFLMNSILNWYLENSRRQSDDKYPISCYAVITLECYCNHIAVNSLIFTGVLHEGSCLAWSQRYQN